MSTTSGLVKTVVNEGIICASRMDLTVAERRALGLSRFSRRA